ncbi:MAG: AraC family transcriptional regulator, partial [Romboutsia sp.]
KLGLNFVNIFDSNDLVTSLINTKMNILKLLVILFLIGLVLILSISYFQYLPIRRIHNILNNKKKNNSDKNNELKSIEMLVTDIIYQNEELLVKNEALYHIDKNQLLLDLIEGVGQDRENKEKHKFILDLESQCHNYYIVLVKKSQLSKESKLSIHNILPTENNRYMTFTIQIPLQDKLGILVVHKDSTISRQESLKDIENKLSILEDNIYFYCGQVYEELAKINHSYIEAMVACDYIVNDSKNRSILYREAKYSNEQIINYPYDIEEKLAHGLKQGTQEVVNDSLKEIFEFINLNKYYSEEIKVYSFYLINFIVRIATLIDFPREEINIRELSKYNNLEIFEENILKLVDSINKFVLSKRSKVRDKFREGIFTDILQNYRSHDLSLELISQKYDYSVPYLSKMIKEETGTTFTKYIQDLRFNYIKEKLVETDLSIKEIIFQAGYYDISNFSRKFKNIMGVTPGQYREINKESKNLEIL